MSHFKILCQKFFFFYLMDKALSGKLSWMQTDPVYRKILEVNSSKNSADLDQTSLGEAV